MFMLLIIIYLAFIGIGLPNALLGAAWPSMYEDMSVPDSFLGIASMIIMGCAVFANVCSGKLLKRFKMSFVMTVCVLMIAAALLGIALSGNFAVLCLCAIPLGLGVGVIDPSLNSYVAVHYKAKHINWLHGFWGIGAAAGPALLSYGMIRTGSWHFGYFTIGGFQIVLACILIFTLSLWEKVPAAASEKANETIQTDLRVIFRLQGIYLSLAAFFFSCALQVTVSVWGSSFLVSVKHLSVETAAGLISLFFFGIISGRLGSGFLTVKLDNRTLIRLGCVIFAIGILTIVASFGNVAYWTGFFLMGIGCAPIFPSLVRDTPVYFGKEYSQSIIGLQMASAYIGAAVVPPLFGAAAARVSYGLFPLFLSVLLAGVIVASEFLNKKRAKNRRSFYTPPI